MSAIHRRLIAMFLLMSIAFLSAIFALQGALLDAIIDGFSLKATSQGLANATAFAGGIVALLAAFFLQGRRRKRALLKASIGLCAAALALLWLAPGYGIFCAVWFVEGFGLAMMDTLLSACMADLYTGRRATDMLCVLHTFFGVASVLSPIGYQALLEAGMPWKRVYLVVALCGAALLAAAVILKALWHIPDGEVLHSRTATPRDILGGIRQGKLAILVAAMLFHGIFLSGLNTWINRYSDLLGGHFSIPAQSCLFFGIMLCRLLMPLMPIRAGQYVRFGGILGAAVLAVGLCMPHGLGLRACLILSGLLAGALIPCILSLGCERLRKNTLLVTTAMMLALYAGQAVSSPLIAALESAFGLRAGIALCAVCMALCSGLCVADAARLSGGKRS